MKETDVIPYDLPEVENHSFFFIDQSVLPDIEAKLHRHDAWELYYVVTGFGNRMVGDTLLPFKAGDVALLPPGIHHQWQYSSDSVGENGKVHYLMSAFSHKFVENCISCFPEVGNRLSAIDLPVDAITFGTESSRLISAMLKDMVRLDDVGRLGMMIRLLPVIFTTSDYTFAGKPVKIEKDVRRIQHIAEYVMTHYIHDISLDEISKEVGMNRSAFCSYFKKHKGMTFTQFVTNYRMKTAAELLMSTDKQVSDICYAVGYNDLPHFIRTFTRIYGISPTKYRKTK